MASFGRFVKSEREKKGWSQTEFGALVKINTPLVSRIENDKKTISPSRIKLLSELFGVDYDKVKDLYFADRFAKDAFKFKCTDKVFAVAETQIRYLREINSKQGTLKF